MKSAPARPSRDVHDGNDARARPRPSMMTSTLPLDLLIRLHEKPTGVSRFSCMMLQIISEDGRYIQLESKSKYA